MAKMEVRTCDHKHTEPTLAEYEISWDELEIPQGMDTCRRHLTPSIVDLMVGRGIREIIITTLGEPGKLVKKANGPSIVDPKTYDSRSGACPICGKEITNVYSHLRMIHNTTKGELGIAKRSGGGSGATHVHSPCPYCTREFSTIQGLAMHKMRTHHEQWNKEKGYPVSGT